jgi:hypothetical protein
MDRTQLSRGPLREQRFPASPLVRVRNMLPSNGRCLQSHYLATVYMLQYVQAGSAYHWALKD